MQAAHDSMEAVTSVVALPEGARVEFQTARKRDYEMQNWPGDLQGYYRPNTPTMVSVRTDLADNQRATMVHEFAHLLDFEHSGYTQELKLDTPSQPTMELFEALNSGTPYFRAQNQPDWIAYASGDAEVFARGFAQYVALRSPKAGQDLKLAISREVGIGQWTDGQFVPIAAAFDAYFAAKGMTPKR